MKNMLVLMLLCFFAAPAFADKNMCLYHTAQVERQRGIKENILSTIALVESGRADEDNAIGHPWPWTVTYGGKGFYFDTKEDAVAEVRKLQSQGIKSVDVGCMQVNLYYHPNAFSSLEEAFDPRKNIEYAADFVTRLYGKHGTWGGAATAYHSHEPEKAYKYENKLIIVWARLKKHLATGGKLYEEREPAAAVAEIAKKAETVQDTIEVASIADKTQPVTAAEFATQWRARKLTEYRLRRAEKNQVYRSNANSQEENL